MQSNKLYFGGKEESCHPASPNAATWICAACPPTSPPGRPASWLLCETTNSIGSFACLSPFCRLCNLLPLLYHYTTTNCVLQTARSTWPMLLEPNLRWRTLNPRALIRRLQKLPGAAPSKVRPYRAACRKPIELISV